MFVRATDEISIFEDFKAIVGPTGIEVIYYPPPSPEEEVTNKLSSTRLLLKTFLYPLKMCKVQAVLLLQ